MIHNHSKRKFDVEEESVFAQATDRYFVVSKALYIELFKHPYDTMVKEEYFTNLASSSLEKA